VWERPPGGSGARTSSLVTRVVVTVFALAMGGTACAERPRSGPATTGKPDAAARLKKAVAATLEAKSFRVEVKAACPPGSKVAAFDFQYLAPDRLRTRTSKCLSPVDPTEASTEEPAGIRIGKTVYSPVPGRPGFFARISVAADISVGDFLPGMEWALGAESVEQGAEGFTFSFPPEGLAPGGEGEARVSEGRLVWLAIHYEQEGERVTDTYTFSMFSSVPAIEAPSEDRVVPYETGLPPCGQDGSLPPDELICGSTGKSEGESG
jgi:hypothetical protein